MRYTRETWERIGSALAQQRGRIDSNAKRFAKTTRLNYRMIYDIEHGKRDNYRPAKLSEIEAAYELPAGWIEGSLREIEAGRGPLPLPPVEPTKTEEGLTLTAEELEDEHVQIIMGIEGVPMRELIPAAKEAYRLQQEKRRRQTG